MASALAKLQKNSHGIHLSSPPASATVDQTKTTKYNPDTPWIKEEDLKKMLRALSSFHILLNTLDDPGNVQHSLPPSTQPHPVNSAFPGVLGMFSVPAPEHNGQEACLLHEHRTASECGPDASNMPHSSLARTRVFPSDSHRVINSQGYTAFLVTPDSLTHAQIAVTGRPPLGKTWPGRVAIDHVSSTAVKQQQQQQQQQQCLSRQAGLHERALNLQRRLLRVLGEHTVNHCNHQLESLREHCQSLSSSSHRRLKHSKPSTNGPFSWQKQPCLLQEVREFSRSSQVLLGGLQEALDSEATASSSSDEELDDISAHGNNSSLSHSCDWLKERAELGSRWSWLQLRVSELEGRIQHLVGVYENIRFNKGGVLLADYKPLAEIHQSQVKASPDSSFTYSDTDSEPCSTARLLQNIEEQSAQLNQIVNNLLPPFGISPPPKQTHTWSGNQTSNRTQISRELFLSGNNKRNACRTRIRISKVDSSCTCARTRPLVSYQKPKLFTYNSCKANKLPDPGDVRCDPSSCPSLTSCLCDPTVWSSRHNSSSSTLFSRSCSPSLDHKYKQYVKNHKKSVFKPSRSAQSQIRKTRLKKPKRRRIQRAKDEDLSHLLRDLSESFDDDFDERGGEILVNPQSVQGRVHKHQTRSESVFNINNVLLPVSLRKVEKLQCKNILTPCWRIIEMCPLHHQRHHQRREDLSDQTFSQRHQPLEVQEKRLWSSWEKRKECRRSTGSGSRTSGCGGGTCTSGEESSLDRSSVQMDVNQQPPSSEEDEKCLFRSPWKPRVFPLDRMEDVLH